MTICLFLMGYTAFAWAQFPGPMPDMAHTLLGTEQEEVAVPGNVVVDFTLDSGFVLSGNIDANGELVFGATVFAQSETEIFSGSTTSTFDPLNPLVPVLAYRIVLPAGTYRLFMNLQVVEGPLESLTLLSFVTYDLQETVVVSGDTEKALVVPMPPEFFTVSGEIVKPGSFPQEGILRLVSEDGRIFNIASVMFEAEGEASAAYSLTLPAGTYVATYFSLPPTSPDPEVAQQLLTIPVGTIAVSADQNFDVTLPATVTLSGQLLDGSGAALAGATVFAIEGLPVPPPTTAEAETPPEMPPPVTDLCSMASLDSPLFDLTVASAILSEGNTMGFYEMPVVPLPEAYQVAVSTPVELLPPATVPPSTLDRQEGDLTFPFPPDMMTIMADQMRDFTSPAVAEPVVIAGTVTDALGQPVVGADVDAESSMLTATPNALFSNDVKTDEEGRYQLLALPGGNYRVRVCPPASAPPGNPLP